MPLARRLASLIAASLLGLAACAVLLSALPALAAPAAPAAVIIYPGGLGCTGTLQDCLTDAPSGATIQVQPGTYITDPLTLDHAVSLTGVSSATVILQAVASQRVLSVTGSAVDGSVVISGLTFAGGQALGGDCPEGCGGALLITGTATPRLRGLTFSSNSADDLGGALYAEAGSPLALSDVRFVSNTSQEDGGAAYFSDSAELSGGAWVNNQCQASDCFGGALLANTRLTVTGADFLSNTSWAAGGAAFVWQDAAVSRALFQDNDCLGPLCSGGGLDVENNLSMTGTRVLNNNSTSEGGGVFVFVNAAVTNSVFSGNQSLDGGGLYQCEGGGVGQYVNDLFAANTASADGHALYIGSPAGASLIFTTIAGPAPAGAAVYVAHGSVFITDTLIASHSVGIEADEGGSVLEDYNLFAGVAAPYSGAVASPGHSLTGSAGFAGAAAGDFHLSAGSAAINAGVEAGIHVDIDGDPRPLGAGFDIGYDEYSTYRLFLPLVWR